jgi:hypothetical protein
MRSDKSSEERELGFNLNHRRSMSANVGARRALRLRRYEGLLLAHRVGRSCGILVYFDASNAGASHEVDD